MVKTLGCAALVWSLALGSAVAFDEDSPADKSENEGKREAVRSLDPTPADLEGFSLPNPGLSSDRLPETGPPLFQFSGYGMFVAAGTDFATTELGLSRGLEEGNPVASNRSVRLLHHVVGPAAVWWTTTELQKNGKTKLATSLRIALMAAYGYATLHNIRRMNGLP